MLMKGRAVRLFSAGILSALFLLALCEIAIPWAIARPCPNCRGGMAEGQSRYRHCCECEDTGTPDSLRLLLVRKISALVARADDIAFCFWLGVGPLTAVGLGVGLRSGVCPLCAGAGWIRLEVRPPGKPVYRRKLPCSVCEGKGGVTRLDRWLAGV
jgi:hypothetical protein